MDENIYITIISSDPELAKDFYLKNLGFEEKFKNEKMLYLAEKFSHIK